MEHPNDITGPSIMTFIRPIPLFQCSGLEPSPRTTLSFCSLPKMGGYEVSDLSLTESSEFRRERASSTWKFMTKMVKRVTRNAYIV
ncbi:hypothetical protein VNO77_24131 [Canavalia gladiata]|uniref:Uncharacterized protein n=1 Tax=Canavalia gladiata TaxID=3824 RepID=A0AAN9LB07_CANGL